MLPVMKSLALMWVHKARRGYDPARAVEGQAQDTLEWDWVCVQAWATVGQLVVCVASWSVLQFKLIFSISDYY